MKPMSALPRVALAALALLAGLLFSTLLFALVFDSLIAALYAVSIIAPPFFPTALLSLYWVYHLPGRPRSIPPSHYRAIITFSFIIAASMLPYIPALFWIRNGSTLPAVLALVAYAGLNLWAALVFSRSQALTYQTPDLDGGGMTVGDADARRRKRRLYLSCLILIPTWGAMFLFFRGHELIGGILLALAMIPSVLFWREMIVSARH